MGWTFLVLLLVPYRRFKAGFSGQLAAEDFRCGESARVPHSVAIPNRIFMNLIEMPALFYVLCVILFVTHQVDNIFVELGWAYFAMRIVHSLIYLTYNHVVHRFFSFAISNLLVVAIWLRLIIVLTRQ